MGPESKLTLGQTLVFIQPDNTAHSLRCKVIWAGGVTSNGHDPMGLEFLGISPAVLED